MSSIKDVGAVILAVAHKEYKEMQSNALETMYSRGKKVLLDVKGILDRSEYEEKGYLYWRL